MNRYQQKCYYSSASPIQHQITILPYFVEGFLSSHREDQEGLVYCIHNILTLPVHTLSNSPPRRHLLFLRALRIRVFLFAAPFRTAGLTVSYVGATSCHLLHYQYKCFCDKVFQRTQDLTPPMSPKLYPVAKSLLARPPLGLSCLGISRWPRCDSAVGLFIAPDRSISLPLRLIPLAGLGGLLLCQNCLSSLVSS